MIKFAGMKKVRRNTEERSLVIVQKTKICNHGEARYKLDNAKFGLQGYDLNREFKTAVRSLPRTYSKVPYMKFLDNWGTVRKH